MTPAKAKVIFASHMQAARSRKLSPYELKQLSTARQVLRQSRKPAMNAPHKQISPDKYWFAKGFDDACLGIRPRNKIKQYVRGYREGKHYCDTREKYGHPTERKQNPAGVLIYGEVQTIYAKKTQNHQCDDDCKAHGHRYYHKFSSKPKMYGLPDGTILIKP